VNQGTTSWAPIYPYNNNYTCCPTDYLSVDKSNNNISVCCNGSNRAWSAQDVCCPAANVLNYAGYPVANLVPI
jgi:hypothetical protein